MTEQQLNDAVHRLTRNHRVTHTDPHTGKTSYLTVLSLFTQLRQEQASGNRRSGGSKSTGSRSPIAINAVTLWSEIRETLSTRFIAFTGKDDTNMLPETKLQKWAVSTLADTTGRSIETCLRTATTWATSIESLISPTPRIEVRGACPACAATHAWTWDQDEYVRNTAITATRHEARCGACGTTWAGADIHDLAETLGQAA
ncbi:hypothetical protein [Pseudarthrobacter sp. NamE5]|uniref:DUF7341 domain-containing protein n=1 Tax=Pseudarthrobacter sp. NamE5 TaxID=2576839 RepID=UPI00110C122B|nr:hypothetical protein [Pseudarthrobacter sp. NamE5]TLM87223.1 hypothetical protein FDW84_05360 [Pseudarthrobacter sp. NamE5]